MAVTSPKHAHEHQALSTHRWLDHSRLFGSGRGERGRSRGRGWGRGRGRYYSVPFLLLLFDGLFLLFDPLRLCGRFSAYRPWAAKLVSKNLLEPQQGKEKKKRNRDRNCISIRKCNSIKISRGSFKRTIRLDNSPEQFNISVGPFSRTIRSICSAESFGWLTRSNHHSFRPFG